MSKDKGGNYLPILGNGERLIESVTKKFPGGPTTYPRTFEEAKIRVINQLNTVQKQIDAIPEENKMPEVILALRLNEKFLAKSYTPETFFKKTGFENIGSRRWVYDGNSKKTNYSKLHFIKVDQESLSNLRNSLETDIISLTVFVNIVVAFSLFCGYIFSLHSKSQIFSPKRTLFARLVI